MSDAARQPVSSADDAATSTASLDWRPLAAILAIAFVLRTFWLIRPGWEWTVATDSRGYLRLARGLVHGCGFADFNTICWTPEAMRTPGYPVFLVPFLGAYRLAILVQAVMGALVCLVAARFTTHRYGARAGLIAAALIAIDVPTILASKQLLTEALFQLMFTLAILSSLEGRGLRAGLLAGLSALVRPIAEPMIVVVAVALAAKRRWGELAMALGAALLIIGAWSYRNQRTVGVFTLTVEGPMNLYSFTMPGMIALRDGVSLEAGQRAAANEIEPFVFSGDELARAAALPPHDGIEWATHTRPAIARVMLVWTAAEMMRHPLNAARLTLTGLAELMFVPHKPANGLEQMIHRGALFDAIKYGSMAFEGAFLLVVWIGVIRALIADRTDPDLWILLAAAILLMSAAAPFTGGLDPRYRVPAIPFLAILAGIGWMGRRQEINHDTVTAQEAATAK